MKLSNKQGTPNWQGKTPKKGDAPAP